MATRLSIDDQPQWEQPGDLLHIGVQSLARFHQVGHRGSPAIASRAAPAASATNEVLLAVDDATWMGFVEVLADEKQPTVIGFLARAVAWFNGLGIDCRRVMSDNGPANVSKAFAKACNALGLWHIRIRTYTPRTNGKAERFIQTLCREWAYGTPFHNSEERNRWLPRYLSIYNRLRRHSALGWRSPQQPAQRAARLSNVMRNNIQEVLLLRPGLQEERICTVKAPGIPMRMTRFIKALQDLLVKASSVDTEWMCRSASCQRIGPITGERDM